MADVTMIDKAKLFGFRAPLVKRTMPDGQEVFFQALNVSERLALADASKSGASLSETVQSQLPLIIKSACNADLSAVFCDDDVAAIMAMHPSVLKALQGGAQEANGIGDDSEKDAEKN